MQSSEEATEISGVTWTLKVQLRLWLRLKRDNKAWIRKLKVAL